MPQYGRYVIYFVVMYYIKVCAPLSSNQVNTKFKKKNETEWVFVMGGPHGQGQTAARVVIS